MPVDMEEYKSHKEKCAKSFEDFETKLDKLNRAMFGEEDLDQLGVLEMTKQLHDSMRMAKGGQRVFWLSVKIAGGIGILIGSYYSVKSFIIKVILG